MALRHASWLGLCALIACSSQGGSLAETHATSDDDAGTTPDASAPDASAPDASAPDASDDAGSQFGSGDSDAGPPATLTPSNLPADICDVSGMSNLDVPEGTTITIDSSTPCDALVPQGDGLPSICVHEYATVTIAGTLNLRGPDAGSPAVAIVATGAFTVAGGGIIDARGDAVPSPVPAREGPGAPDSRGAGALGTGGGAGHVTPGADSGLGRGGGGAVPTTGSQLAAGSAGAQGSSTFHPGGSGGRAGGAIQLVSCTTLDLHGIVSVSGTDGFPGEASVSAPSGGGGGGSGGTLLLEAAQISADGATFLALGGSGGGGGFIFNASSGDVIPGGAGGTGGSGSSAPQAGQPGVPGPQSFPSAPGGGGGAIGRIAINVPAGASLPIVNADPPASFGVVATH